MADPQGKVSKIQYKVGISFEVFLDNHVTALLTDDLFIQQTLAAALEVQEEVTLPLKDGKIQRVERANPIPPNPGGSTLPPPPGFGKVTGIATQVDGASGKSFFEVFFTISGTEMQFHTFDVAAMALCLSACIGGHVLRLFADQSNVLKEVTLEFPAA